MFHQQGWSTYQPEQKLVLNIFLYNYVYTEKNSREVCFVSGTAYDEK